MSVDATGLSWRGGSTFCVRDVAVVKPGTWALRGADTALGPDVCLLVRRDFTTLPPRVSIAYNPAGGGGCPDARALVSGAGGGDWDAVVLDVGELVEDTPEGLQSTLAVALLGAGATLLAAGFLV